MAEEDEFGALYGVEAAEEPAAPLFGAPEAQLAPDAAAAIANGDEEDLYQQLYGEAAPAEVPGFGSEPAAAPVKQEAPVAAVAGAGDSAQSAQAAP